MLDIAIYRHQLFKFSEPFITQQAQALKQYKCLYLGRERFGEGPNGSETLSLSDLPGQRRFSRRLWQVLTRDPRPYVQLIGKYRPALIHAHFGVDGVYALPLARKLGVPLVTTFHGFDATLSKKALLVSHRPSWINYALWRPKLAQQGDLFLCVSEFIRHRVIDLGFPEERTHVHYIGIDTQAIGLRNIDDEKPMVLHVARLVENKGTEYLIRAFAQIAPAFPDVELIIIGDGPLRKSLKTLAYAVGLKNRFHFLGICSHAKVMATMTQASMLVLPSVTARRGDAEGLGMVLLEAAALGVPVIGTQHGGIPEAVMDGRTGFLVPERDADTLAVRMRELLEDNNLRISMGRQGRILCETRFDIRKQTEKLEAFYASVLV